jgi:DEAD/DEAH box helicase domain-containing protein
LGVFEQAYDVLKNCACQNDPEKDGCYRCLLAYRGHHDQLNTSRLAALELLKLILDNRQHLKRTEHLNAIRINRLLESELEARFIDALSRPAEGEALRSVTRQVVHGKEGFYMRSDSGNYLIEPQVELGPEQGVAVTSRADFVFYPERPEQGELPIVVFADGYEYHADPNSSLRIGTDTAQRMALMRSGRYRVWSLTWVDVQEQFKNPVPLLGPALLPPGPKFNAVLNNVDPGESGNWKSLSGLSSFGILTLLLGAGRRMCWARYAQAYVVNLLENDPDTPGRLRFNCQRLHSDGSPLLQVGGGIETTALQGRNFDDLEVRLQLFDDFAHHGLSEWKQAWREFLRLGNLLQFLPRFEFVSSLGLSSELYEPIFESPIEFQKGKASDQLASLMELVAHELRDLCAQVAQRGKPLPQAGFELTGEVGEIIATAELAWPSCHIAVFLEHEADGMHFFETAGWRVFAGDDVRTAPEQLLDVLPDEVSA